MKIIIGIDPDSDKHGVAIYADGHLCELESMGRIDIVRRCISYRDKGLEVLCSIEDVVSNKSTWRANAAITKQVAAKMGYNIGMLAQSCTELMRDLDHNAIAYKLHKPSSCWKDAAGKKQFMLTTKWDARSNEDTRSAAYFGWLECK